MAHFLLPFDVREVMLVQEVAPGTRMHIARPVDLDVPCLCARRQHAQPRDNVELVAEAFDPRHGSIGMQVLQRVGAVGEAVDFQFGELVFGQRGKVLRIKVVFFGKDEDRFSIAERRGEGRQLQAVPGTGCVIASSNCSTTEAMMVPCECAMITTFSFSLFNAA